MSGSTFHNRFEIKYVVDGNTARRLRAELDGFTRRDEHAADDRGYRVCSVYWDSPDRALFWEKVEGVKFRRKLRFRWYAGAEDQVFVEIKQRTDRTIQKRRVRWPASRVRDVFYAEGGSDGRVDDRVAAESLFLVSAYGLRPAMGISYRRLAYFGGHDDRLRVTFDTDVRYHADACGIGTGLGAGKYVVPPESAVVEIKFNDSVPRWLCGLVARFGLRTVRLSKYCRAVDLEHYGGVLT